MKDGVADLPVGCDRANVFARLHVEGHGCP
jgi:hypothetical protein